MLPKRLPARTAKAPCWPVARPPVPNAAPAASRPMSAYTAPSVAYPNRASRSIHGCARRAAYLAWSLASSERLFLELMPSSRARPRESRRSARTVYQFRGERQLRTQSSAALGMIVGVTSYAARIMQNTEHGPWRRANRFVQDQPP